MNNDIYNRIFEKKNKLDSKRPLSKSTLERIRENLNTEFVYNSNAIEGNTLTLAETRLVLEEGITIKGKPLKYHLEAKNHQEAIEFVEDATKNKTKISENLLNQIHGIILENIEKEFAGIYRREQVRILGADFIPPNFLKLPELMADFIKWVNINPDKLNIIKFAAMAHFKLTYIHPWVDGNGRVSRLLMNIILMKDGYPPAVILNNDRKKYISALRLANRGDFGKFYLLVSQAIERSLDIYLMSIGAESGELMPLSELAKKVNFSQEYLSLLSRKGDLGAIKMNRNWLSSEEAVERYIKNRKRKR